MIDAELAFAFSAGMVATVNPCGFAMLPAYLSYFLGLEGADTDTRSGVLRGVAVGAVVTAGFVLVFGLMGLAITQFSLSINEQLPWVTMVIGVALFGLGIAMLRGFQLTVRLPKLQMGTGSRELSSMFLFGISYAVASLSCTLPIFLVVVTNTFETASFASGVAVFVAYAVGMGVVLMAITLALSLAKGSLVRNLRRALPHINTVSGVLLVVAGAYVAYYGYYEWRLFTDPSNPPAAGPVQLVTEWNADITNWVNRTGATTIGWVLGGALVAVVAAVLLTRRRGTDRSAGAAPEDSAGRVATTEPAATEPAAAEPAAAEPATAD
ncbi:MAG TPA: cytochrome c biogenesis CcdA family protein [Acidimicrobiales bacterium]|nr:cytochrome c biogenesis CcdA family protein [Acidimicrobiales bacterium]